jgi:histidinol phosphatase-like enzyme (inositol monophosphatase family)
MTVDQALLDWAVDLAQRAGELSLKWFRQDGLDIDQKRDGSPVTVADRTVERFLREEISARYPDDGVLGEEEAELVGSSGRRWIVDPIDGTKAFTHGVPLYANLVALEDPDGIAIGIINRPGLGETVGAGRGLGCWCNGTLATVSQHAGLKDRYVTATGFDDWDNETLLRVKATGAFLRTWGDAYGYALVATGRVEAMVDVVAERYDLAPMPVIIAEAGGRFTDWSGIATYAGGNGVATNGVVHDELLAALR